jgi:DnaJ-domain-containing protein 1
MSIPRRLLNIAKEKLMEGVEGFGDLAESVLPPRGRRGDAASELEDYLRDPHGFDAPPPPPPPPHPLAAEYTRLGLEPGVPLEAVRRAWRRLARDNHPDRFPGDPKAQAAARERFLTAQQAYEKILAHMGAS